MRFEELKLQESLLRAVRAEGYTEPTPIQAQAIPYVLLGRDLLGCAQTGTGKTAAFALPILQRLDQTPRRGRGIRVLVLSPTRELASQIGESFETYGRNTGIRQVTIFGGVGQQPQVDALRRQPEILVATPGRLLDLMNQGYVNLDTLEVFVLDEADRMLDMGFIHDVRRVVKAIPTQRQTLLFSATMPKDIVDLAQSILREPVYVEVTPAATTVEKIDQSVFFVNKVDKISLLEHLLRDRAITRVLVFTRTKHGADKVVKQLVRDGIHAEAIHGNKSQTARERALSNFKSGVTRVLVATDIAARGLDVENVSHVINFDLPNEPESYVHRIGRTARAGAEGIAFSFCDAEERAYLRDIERLIRLRVPVVSNHPYAAEFVGAISAPPPQRRQQPQQNRSQSYGNGGGNRSQQPTRQPSAAQPARSTSAAAPTRANISSDHDRLSNGAAPSVSVGAPMGDQPAKRRRRRRKPASERTPTTY